LAFALPYKLVVVTPTNLSPYFSSHILCTSSLKQRYANSLPPVNEYPNGCVGTIEEPMLYD